MQVSYKSKKLERDFSGSKLQQIHGPLRAKKIRIRLAEFEAAISLYDFWPPKSGPGRCHELTEGQHGQLHHLSVDLDHPYRLIFAPDHDPVPFKDDGGLDWKNITKVVIWSVEDTHG